MLRSFLGFMVLSNTVRPLEGYYKGSSIYKVTTWVLSMALA